MNQELSVAAPPVALEKELDPSHRLRRELFHVAVQGLIVAGASIGAVGAAAEAPPAHLTVAGQDVTVRSTIGQNYSRLNAPILRQDHATIPLINKPVGIDVSFDINAIDLQDKQVRAAFKQFGQDPAPQVARIKSEAVKADIENAAFGFGSLFILGEASAAALYRRRRLRGHTSDSPETSSKRHDRAIAIASALLTLTLAGEAAGAAAAGKAMLHNDIRTVIGTPALDTTPLKGTEIDGLTGQALPYILALLKQSNPQFIQTASERLKSLIDSRPDLHDDKDTETFVVADDLQFNNLMARLWGELADDVDADFLVNTGDIFQFANPYESLILDTPTYYSHKKPIYLSPGLHDTNAGVNLAKVAGWNVITNKTVVIDGLTLRFVASPVVSDISTGGSGDSARNPEQGKSDTESIQTDVENTTADICKDKPTITFLHQNDLGHELAQTGCTDVVVDGRSYTQRGLRQVKTVTNTTAAEYTSGSGAGNTNTSINTGPIHSPAYMTVFKFDKASRELSYSTVTFKPSGDVVASPLKPVTLLHG